MYKNVLLINSICFTLPNCLLNREVYYYIYSSKVNQYNSFNSYDLRFSLKKIELLVSVPKNELL